MSFIPVTWEAKEYLDVKAGMDNLMIDPQNKMLKIDVLIVKQGTKSCPSFASVYICFLFLRT